MSQIIQWLTVNWPIILGALTGLIAVATLVAKLTPTDKDDLFLARVAQWLSVLQPKGVSGSKLPLTPPTKPEVKEE